MYLYGMTETAHKPFNIRTAIGALRIVAILEGISYLLFAITMPLKYMMGIKEPNMYVGMAHGWLFLGYIVLALYNGSIYKWSIKTRLIALAASIIPFGTFWADKKIFKPLDV